jgi:hypothetical protein
MKASGMKRLVLLAAFAGMAAAGQGQTPLKFRSMEWLGLSAGEVGSAGFVQTVNGVAKGPWFLGAGAGVDYYRFRSVALFGAVTRDIAIGKKDWLLLNFDGGTNVPWYTPPNLLNPGNPVISDVFHGGEYWSGGVGYLWKLGAHTNNAVLFSVGYTVKKMSEHQVVETHSTPIAPPADNNLTYDYTYLNRMYQFMVGFRF